MKEVNITRIRLTCFRASLVVAVSIVAFQSILDINRTVMQIMPNNKYAEDLHR